jgi:hypothetical protein
MEIEIKGDTKKFKRLSPSIIYVVKDIIEEYNLSDITTRIVLTESINDIIIIIFTKNHFNTYRIDKIRDSLISKLHNYLNVYPMVIINKDPKLD